jgi:hypothetical protein
MSEILRFQKAIMRLTETTPQFEVGIRCRHLQRHNIRVALDRAEVAFRTIERMATRGEITPRQKAQMIKNVQKHLRRYGA